MKSKVTNINLILAAVIVLLIGYVLLYNKTDNSVIDIKYKTEIDSLNQAIILQHQKQLALNEMIITKELTIVQLDLQIDSTKQVITQQRKYYGEKIKNAGRYTPTELDSFFSNRYK